MGRWASIRAGTGLPCPGCRTGYSPLLATMILAPLVAGWHLPTFFLEEGGLRPSVLVAGLVTTMAVTFWYAWLFNHTGGQHSPARSGALRGRKHPVRARLDRYGRVVRGSDRVGRLRLEGLARPCARAGYDPGDAARAPREATPAAPA